MKSNNTLIFFCGPHCSGKTTILKDLLETGILQFYGAEIGKEFFYRKEITPEIQDDKFEIKLTEFELSRDFECLQKKGLLGIETWHPGNLAYASVRNPSVVSTLAKKMKTSPFITNSFGIRFCVSPENIMTRTKTFKNSPEWAVDFYSKIDSELDICIEKLGLKNNVFNVDSNRKYEEVFDEVKAICSYITKLQVKA